jgi:hypothetical protein
MNVAETGGKRGVLAITPQLWKQTIGWFLDYPTVMDNGLTM